MTAQAPTRLTKADFTIDAPKTDEGAAVLRLKGAWVVTQIEGVSSRLRNAIKPYDRLTVDDKELTALDTSGAYVLKTVAGSAIGDNPFPANENYRRLYDLVSSHSVSLEAWKSENPEKARFWLHPVYHTLIHLGQLMVGFGKGFYEQSIFLGHTVTLMMISLVRPSRMRWAALFNLMQRSGIEALPIVAVTNFFIGAVIAFLMVLTLKQFGAAVFTVDMVGIGVLREFGPVITAVLMTGRSASAYTAEIGSMKMNQEIDAMRTMGIDPFEALVVPRMFALLIMTPLVTFVGMMAGLVGGALAVWVSLGSGPVLFVQRLYDYVPSVNLFVGMIKTPAFAATIAVIGCRLGMSVKPDVISLGRQVTKSVVQTIFAVFMIDAIFAILFNGFMF